MHATSTGRALQPPTSTQLFPCSPLAVEIGRAGDEGRGARGSARAQGLQPAGRSQAPASAADVRAHLDVAPVVSDGDQNAARGLAQRALQGGALRTGRLHRRSQQQLPQRYRRQCSRLRRLVWS